MRAEAVEPHCPQWTTSPSITIRSSSESRPGSIPRPERSGPLRLIALFLDPYTGKELGKRREGDITQGRINLVSFLYALHMNLSAGSTGYLILGIVALAWSIDCFVGLYLTMPVSLRGFLRKWLPSWWIKVNAKAGSGEFRSAPGRRAMVVAGALCVRMVERHVQSEFGLRCRHAVCA